MGKDDLTAAMSIIEGDGEGDNYSSPEFDADIIMKRFGNMSEREMLVYARKLAIGKLIIAAEAGILSHQELAVLARLLKDNGVTLVSPNEEFPPGSVPNGPAVLPEVPDFGDTDM